MTPFFCTRLPAPQERSTVQGRGTSQPVLHGRRGRLETGRRDVLGLGTQSRRGAEGGPDTGRLGRGPVS